MTSAVGPPATTALMACSRAGAVTKSISPLTLTTDTPSWSATKVVIESGADNGDPSSGPSVWCKRNLPYELREEEDLNTCPATNHASLPIERAHCNAALGRPNVRFAVRLHRYRRHSADDHHFQRGSAAPVGPASAAEPDRFARRVGSPDHRGRTADRDDARRAVLRSHGRL